VKLPGPQFVRFLVVGVLNTAFGYGLFALFTWFGLAYPLAIALATILGVLFNFQTTGRMVFSNSRGSLLWRFAAVYGIIYLLNVAAVALLLRAGINVYLANALAIPPLVVCSFILQRLFVFNKP
jgi:putative flippase GtrA